MQFKDDFVWGAAAASYQIEGAAYTDGRGLSVWDVFSHTPGKTFNGETGDVACDHYNRYQEDVALMKEIGLQAYRLSLAWPRVLPDGTGQPNEAGLDFYDRLVDELLKANITPYITLFHWDLPYTLYTRGGWLNRNSMNWFMDYTALVTQRLGDRVKNWMTFNEPAVFSIVGHHDGRHAPGDKLNDRNIWRIIHNVLRAHGAAADVIRSNVDGGLVSIVPNTAPSIPESEAPAHVDAARDHYWTITKPYGWWNVAVWLDPILKGDYPAAVYDQWGDVLDIQAGDLDLIKGSLDYIGVNCYWGHPVETNADGETTHARVTEGYARTMMDWQVTPSALYWASKFIYERYGLPIYITENGLASMDWVAVDGKVHDANRIDFLTRYLREFRRAGADGVDIRGYFQWSIMDNYEWAEGYRKRFGLIHVDFETGKRTLKDSAYWYREVIASNGDILGE